MTDHPRWAWALLGTASVVVLGACVLLAVATGDPVRIGVVVLGGLLALGIGSVWLYAVLSPLPGGYAGSATAPRGAGLVDGGGAGGGGGGDGGC